MTRVVITGTGVVSSLGNDTKTFWTNVSAGKNGIKPITSFDASETGITVASEASDFDPTLTMSRKEYQRMDRFSQFAIAASDEALKNSGLVVVEETTDDIGVLVSSGIGGLHAIQTGILKMAKKGPKRVPPLFVPLTIGNMAAGNIAQKFGIRGISLDIVSACASATNAIGEAYLKIKHGDLTACLAGGCEATINEIGIAGFAALTALSTQTDPERASIPFDARRDGFVMGEGAGVIVLESLENAQKRGATVLAEVVGYGSTADAYHMTAPRPDGSGAGKAFLKTLEDAGIKPEEVDYINAHGTSTPTNDSGETTAIKYAFGEHAKHIPISSTKSMIGHLLGAAGGVEAITCIEALRHQFVPPTRGLKEADPQCDLDYVPNVGRAANLTYVLSDSLGFGGHNAVLCFKRWEE